MKKSQHSFLLLILIQAVCSAFFADCSRANSADSASVSHPKSSKRQSTEGLPLASNTELVSAHYDKQYVSHDILRGMLYGVDNSNLLRRQAFELRKRVEMFGIRSHMIAPVRLEQTLLKSVNDLELIQADRKRLSAALMRLSQAALRFSSTVSACDPEARLSLEGETRNAYGVLAIANPLLIMEPDIKDTLTDGVVVSVKKDFGMIVANLGAHHGVKIGMILNVHRSDKLIAYIRVVDVRDSISGALLHHLASAQDHIKLGDSIIADHKK